MHSIVILALAGLPCLALVDSDRRLPEAPPAQVGMDAERLARIKPVMEQAIREGQLPGAVILVLRQGKICYRESFGLRSKEPVASRMTVDTVFDLASLTKPIATATSLMILLEQGKLRLQDRVSDYLPEFGQNGKDKITIEQLLLHTSGLMADNPVEDYQDGPKKARERVFQLSLQWEPGSRFTYSDVGYIVLGLLAEKIGGERLNRFSKKHIFEPLGMKNTAFKPTPEQAGRAAPTEEREGRWLQGEVHDPRASLLGGVGGHAGLFSTADDLAIYAQMILHQGEFQGHRILSPATVRLMTTPRQVPGGWRALGWDVQTSFSSNRGELFPFGSFGHTGFTGTSIWIDPSSQTAVIFLSSRVHPKVKNNINRLRGQVATLVAASIVAPPFPKAVEVDPL
jgi:CubicO group peptidase (beta-lactamase class C family)